jgi:hypothetical protein
VLRPQVEGVGRVISHYVNSFMSNDSKTIGYKFTLKK